MSMIISISLFLTFIALGMLHFHWAFGGKFGFSEAVPTMKNGKKVINPGRIDCAVVGIGLTLFALYYFFRSELVGSRLPGWLLDYGGWIIPVIFLLRAIGEFRYIGFFKSVRDTPFGKQDTKLYSPLCLGIGAMGIGLQLFA